MTRCGIFLRAYSRVGDDADDLARAVVGQIRVRLVQANLDDLAQRVAALEELPRQGLVDDDHTRRRFAVRLSEHAPAQQRDAHRREVVLAHFVVFRSLAVRAGVAGLADDTEWRIHPSRGRQRRRHADGAHTRQGLHSVQDLPEELRCLGRDAEVRRVVPCPVSTRADQQDQRHGDLYNDQRAANALARRTARSAASLGSPRATRSSTAMRICD
jgi:hypothetical protein